MTTFEGCGAFFGCQNNETGAVVPLWAVNAKIFTRVSLYHSNKFSLLNDKLQIYDINIQDNNTSVQCFYLFDEDVISSDIAFLQVVLGGKISTSIIGIALLVPLYLGFRLGQKLG